MYRRAKRNVQGRFCMIFSKNIMIDKKTEMVYNDDSHYQPCLLQTKGMIFYV